MTRFTLLTGIAGEPWVAAAEKVGQELGVLLETVVIGPGRLVTDLYYDWARVREIQEDGALLVRPDNHIGWRSVLLPAGPERALRDALAAILGRGGAA
jgi:2,4-dichlorophenol 6-monooxygenase